MKKIKIPSDLIDKFEQVSGRNTARRKETGGLLFASDQESHYLVLQVLIPKQTGMSVFFLFLCFIL